MPIPDATRDDVLDALKRFDAELRDTDAWHGWEERANHKYAIAHEGKRYPVKHIVATASGAATDTFGGGNEANRWLRQHGIEVIALRSDPAWWWVNQGKQFENESKSGYLWAALRQENGAEPAHWSILSEFQPGDIVVHYAYQAIQAVSVVSAPATISLSPAALDGSAGGTDGRLVAVELSLVQTPIQLSEIPVGWRAGANGPFDKNGGVRQGYAFPLHEAFVQRLVEGFGQRLPPEFEMPEVAAVRALVEQLYPNPETRRQCLTVLADAIVTAHSVSAASWSVSLPKGRKDIRFNVLWTQPCVLSQNDLFLVVDLKTMDADARLAFEEAAGVDARNQPAYPSLPEISAYGVHVPEDRLGDLLPKAREPNQRFIEFCASRVRNRAHRAVEHSPAAIRYLRRELGRDLPQPDGGVPPPPPDGPYKEQAFDRIGQAIAAQGMRLDPRTLRRYHLALKTRGFVVLSGLSGTGKTWLAEAYANAVGARHAVVAVAPNWTTNEDLLGYLNPLTGVYHHTTFSTFVGEAARAYLAAEQAGVAPQPFRLVLDEMNLARVEYYFAQFLSAMEVRARHGSATMALGGGEQLLLPPNLFVIGTVNVDETTHGFADKVYDRAQLIELGVSREDLKAHVAGKAYAIDILDIWDAVQHAGPFTFRILDEVHSYVSAAEAMETHWSHALDEQILQKVFPKLKGADPRIGAALERVVEVTQGRFPLSHAKAARMLEDFRSHGFASYFG